MWWKYALLYEIVKWVILKLFQKRGREDKGERWRGWIQLWYIVRMFLNGTMYLQYNNNTIKINKGKRKKIPNTKQNWWSGLSGRVPTKQAWSLEFKPWYLQIKKKRERETLKLERAASRFNFATSSILINLEDIIPISQSSVSENKWKDAYHSNYVMEKIIK
jgi:hypothetical protein